jgi:hypothetical protein
MKQILGLMTLALMLAAPLYLMGCDDDTGTQDTTVDDSTVDVPPDTGPTDVPADTPPPDTVEPDTAEDTGADAGCVGVTGGICHLVRQCGCSPGFACDIVVDPSCALIEDCVASSGARDVEAECDAAGQCRPGTACLTRSGETVGYCHEWCETSADCSIVGRECNVGVSFTLPDPCTGTATSPYQACSMDCPDDQACGLPDSNTCTSGETCTWDPNCDILGCVTAGTLAAGDDCSGDGDCGEMMGCYSVSDPPDFRCYEFCDTVDGDPACTVGACTSAGSTAYSALGICSG